MTGNPLVINVENRPLLTTPGSKKIKKIKKKASNKISIKLKVLKSVNGYQIKISTSKKFKAKATRTLNINKINFTIKNIKNKKIYYVKVRGYRKENGVNLYGKWSKIKKVK